MVQCPYCGFEVISARHSGTVARLCPECGKLYTITVDEESGETLVKRTHSHSSDAATARATARRGAQATVSGDTGRATVAAPPRETPPNPEHKSRPEPQPEPAREHGREPARRPERASARETLRPEATQPPPTPAPVPTPAPAPASAAPAPEPDRLALREPPRIYQTSAGRAAASPTPRSLTMMGGKLGGYELKRRLGQGGMGVVYLARQMSLDRDVAVKILDKDLGRDAQFVSRFVREAYAAAQLVHHNVVQIHDIGEQEQTHFYSMEFVKGQTLADLIRTEGALEPDVAAGYILQAARGLKLAHDQGMIHRDIKPENLLLSQDGVLKVADLGLVKHLGQTESLTPGDATSGPAGATLARSTMGTPAYMAPEQAADASSVDARADIYSLGCTLWSLLTGHAPFEGNTAQEVLDKVTRHEVPFVRTLNRSVTDDLNLIVRRMTEHDRENRYANLGQVIHDLQLYLGVEDSGKFTPRQQHVDELTEIVRGFNLNTLALVRQLMVQVLGLLAVCLAGTLIWDGRWGWGIELAATAAATTVFYQLFVGLGGKSDLHHRLREAALSADWHAWARAAVIAGLAILAVLALDILWPTLLVGIVSFIMAGLLHLVLDRAVTSCRSEQVARAEAMLRTFRLKGLEEDAMRRFVCEYSGRQWEEFYETLFGYEAKMEARRRWGRSVRGYDRPKFGVWRDPIAHWLEKRQRERKAERERAHLLRVETRNLQSQGLDEVAAAREAKRLAELMLSQAAEMREKAIKLSQESLPAPADPDAAAAVPRKRNPFDLSRNAEKRTQARHEFYVTRRYGGPAEWLFGSRTRFVLAAILLVGFLVWRFENRGLIVQEITAMKGQRIDPSMQDPTKAVDMRPTLKAASSTVQPLEIPAVPDSISSLLGTWNAGTAGLILLWSSFYRNRRIAAPIYPAAAIALAGHYLPAVQYLPLQDPPTAAILLGTAIALVAFLVMTKNE